MILSPDSPSDDDGGGHDLDDSDGSVGDQEAGGRGRRFKTDKERESHRLMKERIRREVRDKKIRAERKKLLAQEEERNERLEKEVSACEERSDE